MKKIRRKLSGKNPFKSAFTRATFSGDNRHFAFFLKSRKKETRAIEKEKDKMPILAAKSRAFECSLRWSKSFSGLDTTIKIKLKDKMLFVCINVVRLYFALRC